MKLFYFCFGRAHSSVISAYLHLNRLPLDRLPTLKELIALPEFDKADQCEQGIPLLMGTDSNGNEIYILGLGKNRLLGLQTIYFTLKARVNVKEWRFIDSMRTINTITRIGGFMSRELHWVFPGRLIVAWGIRQSYWKLVDLVKNVKELS